MMLMPKFATWWRGHCYPGESFKDCDYIVDNRGYEPLPRLIERLCRGEIVPRKDVVFDGVDGELDDLPDVPELDDFTDAQAIRDQIADFVNNDSSDDKPPTDSGESGNE